MICPQCRAEFRQGIERCIDCDVELVASLEEAPRLHLVLLHATHDPEELAAIVGRLEKARVPYVVQAGTALSVLDVGELEQAGSPDDWSARILIVDRALERGTRILSEIRSKTPEDMRYWG